MYTNIIVMFTGSEKARSSLSHESISYGLTERQGFDIFTSDNLLGGDFLFNQVLII